MSGVFEDHESTDVAGAAYLAAMHGRLFYDDDDRPSRQELREMAELDRREAERLDVAGAEDNAGVYSDADSGL